MVACKGSITRSMISSVHDSDRWRSDKQVAARQVVMALRKRDGYLSLRRPFEPDDIYLIIIAESPPAAGRYFYNPEGRVTEPLFAAMMVQLGVSPETKLDGLREFQQRGWVLVDATYKPINNERNHRRRNAAIIRDYGLLCDDLKALMSDRSVPLILIKKNVCQILEPKLATDGFSVLNGGRPIYFPSHGRQRDFHRQFAAVLESA